ncbi:YhgE/Pip domain-containing protein [Streptococcus oricebi]|uniref:ABC-2 type transporter transmembrane domain-containing protein n=1 Tax=Streptococcus oricebi TaxID=1547447 RepID=A0ABS5B5P4_9STRE|nr:YhgE/Pip domain-containing protein [Streptococcus oricebi]MBP2624158.1 hypothetical protein [Streptococcus oricebi]
MFKEWKAILKKPAFIIVILGVSLIPALYNVIFLSSMWNPYEKVSNLPVAVVNKDQQASFNGKTLSIGKDLVKSLEKNDQLDFHFVSENEAKEGLDKGTYYMVVTLPSDLSEKAASILTDQPQQTTIDYQTSSGHSFIASKMSDSAMASLKQNVARNITATYTSALFKNMDSLKSGLSTAADGSQKIAAGGQKLTSGSQNLTNNLQTLSKSSLTFASGADSLNVGLSSYVNGVAKLHEGINSLNLGLTAYTGGVSQLSGGLNQFSPGLTLYTQGVDKLSAGTTTFSSQLANYGQKVGSLSDGLTSLNNQSSNLLAGSRQLASASDSGLQQLNTASNQLASSLGDLAATVSQSGPSPEKVQEIQTLQTALTNLKASLETSPQAPAGQPDVTGLEASLATMESAASSLANSAASDKATIQSSVAATAAYQELAPDKQAEISAAISQSPSQSEAAAQSLLEQVQAMKNQLASLAAPAAGVSPAQADLSVLDQASVALGTSLTEAQGQTSDLTSNLQTLTVSAGQFAANLAAFQGQLANGNNQLASGLTNYTEGLATINRGAAQLATAKDPLNTGMSQLDAAAASLASKNSTLLAALGQLEAGGNTLAAKNAQLTSGASKLVDGSGQLTSKSPELLAGANKLASGAGQIADGSGQLADGGLSLTGNLASLTNGADSLTSGLTNANGQLSLLNTDNSNALALSDPLALSKTDNDHVGANGIAMAPYMISVALFVAAISTNVIFAGLPSGRKPQTRKDWLRARLQVNGLIALLAGLLVYGAVHLIGLTANHELATLGLIVLASLTFMALVTALVTLDNKIGAFLALILLLLQLASSAGTYPLQLTDSIFQKINPWLPMSYSVSALRQTISMNGQITSQVVFMLTILLFCTVFGTLAYRPEKESSAL